MTHAQEKRRTSHSVARGPVRMDHRRRDELMTIGAGFCALVILAIYAASFRDLAVFTKAEEAPRWKVAEEALAGLRPIAEEFDGLRGRFDALVDAKADQANAVAIMKAKLAAASATATPESPEPANP